MKYFATVFWLLSSIHFSAQSQHLDKDSLIRSLEMERSELYSVRQTLEATLDSLKNIKNIGYGDQSHGMDSTYHIRLLANGTKISDFYLRFVYDIVNGKYVYSLTGFTDPHRAYLVSLSLRKLDLRNYMVTYGIFSKQEKVVGRGRGNDYMSPLSSSKMYLED